MSDYSLGTARGVIRLEFQDAGTQQASQAVDNLASSSESAGKRVISALAGAASVVSAAVVGTTAALTVSAIKTGVAYNTLEQTSRAAFKTILGSAEAAEVMMEKIAAFGKTSPFPRQAFIEATQQMLGFGFAADDVIPILQTINDATAALGGNADTIATFSSIFSKIQSNAKISGEEISRLGDIGVDAVTMLADAAGVTGEEMRKRISDGAVGAEEAIAALTAGMNEKFGGAAANVKETWAGATDRIKGAWRDLASALVEPLVSKGGGGTAVDFANSVADALRSAIPIVEKFVDIIGPKLDAALNPVMEKLSSLKNADIGAVFDNATSFVDKFGGAIALAAGGIAGLAGGALSSIPLIGPLFSGLTGPIGLAIGAIVAMFTESEALREAFSGIIDTGGELFGVIMEIVRPFAELFQTVAKLAGDALAPLITALFPALVSILSVVAPILEIIATLFEAFAPILLPLIEMSLMPLMQTLELLTPLLQLLADGLTWVAEKLKEWASGSSGDIESVGSKMQEFLDNTMLTSETVIAWFEENWPKIQETISAVIEGIKAVWQGLVDFFTPIVDAIVLGWNTLQAGIQMFLDWWNAYPAPLIQAVIDLIRAGFDFLFATVSAIWNGIMTAVGAVVGWFMTYVYPVIKAAIDLVVAVMNYVGSVISTIWNTISAVVSSVVNTVRNVISTVWAALVSIVKGIFDPIYDSIKSPLDKALDFISSMKDKIAGFFSGAGQWLYNAGKEIIGGLIRGLENMLSGLTSTLNNITSLIPKNKGPIEKDRVLLQPAGVSIMEGLIGGILAQKPALLAALAGITTDIPVAVMASAGTSSGTSAMLDQMYPSEVAGSSTTTGGDTYFTGDILLSLEDLEQLKTLEDFLDMIRVYKKQRGV